MDARTGTLTTTALSVLSNGTQLLRALFFVLLAIQTSRLTALLASLEPASPANWALRGPFAKTVLLAMLGLPVKAVILVTINK
jgi:hypothetical protein